MEKGLAVRAVLFLVFGPPLVVAALHMLLALPFPSDASDLALAVVAGYFVLFIPALALAQLDQTLADRLVPLRPVLVGSVPLAIGLVLIGLLALHTPAILGEFVFMPVVFAVPFALCSWASGFLTNAGAP